MADAARSAAAHGQVDYYALLNVPQHAPRDAIKAAYTRLARVLHPDKISAGSTVSPSERREAQELFILVDRAYKVLSSDTDRAVYDAFGHEGLDALHSLSAEQRKRREADGGHLSLSPGQVGFVDERGRALRDKLLGRVHLERELEAINRFNVRGAIQINVNAAGLVGNAFEPLSEYDLYDAADGGLRLAFEPPKVTGVVVQQSVEAALSRSDTITLGAHSVTRGTAGMHSLTLAHAHKFSQSTSSEVSLTSSARDPLGGSLKANRTLDQYTQGSLEFVVRDRRTGLNVQAARKLSDTTTGSLQLGFGVESGLLLQLNRSARFGPRRVRSKREQEEEFFKSYYGEKPGEQTDESGTFAAGATKGPVSYEDETQEDADLMTTYFSNGSAVLFLGGGGVGVHAGWSRSLTAKTQAKIGVKVSTSSLEIELTSSRALSAHSKGNVSLTLGLSGVRITARYDRGGLRYVVPLVLSSTMSFGAALVGGAIPALVTYSFSALLGPHLERRRAMRRFRLQEHLIASRTKALAQRGLMGKATAAKVAQANKDHGLVVLRARYGARLHEPCDWRPVEPPQLEDFVLLEQARPRLPSDWDVDDEVADDTGERFRRTASAPRSEPSSRSPASSLQETYAEHPPNIDVTTQLNFLANGTSLELHGGVSKAQLLGFYDPCLAMDGVQPRLYVRYKLASWVFEATFDDLEPVELPSVRATLIGNELSEGAVDWASR